MMTVTNRLRPLEPRPSRAPAIRRALRAVGLLLVAGCASAGRVGGAPAGAYDVVIEGGRVVDGTGAPWFYGDVALRGGRVARVAPPGALRGAAAARRLDARGHVVAPGFIDLQSHSREPFLTGDPRVVSKVTQGVTTEILGEGATNAPANARTAAAGGGALAAGPDARQFTGPRGFDAWLRAMHARGPSTNVGSFVGATTVRVYAKGEAMGPATPAELDTMRRVMRDAMEDGAFGLASALIYPPGTYAGQAELTEVARAMAPYGGVYITHLRSEADRWLEALDEAMAIGRDAGVPVEIYHLKAAGRRNWPKAAFGIAKIDSARRAGLDVQADMYSYVAGGTGLSSCLPPSEAEGGRLYDRLRDSSARVRIRAEMLREQSEWENLCALATPEGVQLVGLLRPEHRAYAGRRLSDVARERNQHWADAVLDLLAAERQRIGTIYSLMSEENVALMMRQPWMKFGTDAGGIDPDSARGLAHPRAYGNFPRVLGKYVRDEGVMPLEEAVRKMTSAAAARLSLQDRGVLREGMWADVVVFDPAAVADRATFERPHQVSAGVRDVFVNGVAVVSGGRHTGARPGQVVRGPGWRGGR